MTVLSDVLLVSDNSARVNETTYVEYHILETESFRHFNRILKEVKVSYIGLTIKPCSFCFP